MRSFREKWRRGAVALALLAIAAYIGFDGRPQQAIAQAAYVMFGNVLSSCAATYTAGTNRAMVITPTGLLCITGTVTTNVIGSTSVDRSTTVTLAGTSQQLMASNSSRKGYLIQNFGCGDAANGILYVGMGVAASTTDGKSIVLPPCGSIFVLGTAVNQEVINITGSISAAKISAKEMQ